MQLSHIAIKALKEHTENYEAVGKPEPGWALWNLKFAQYLLNGNFKDIEDKKCMAKLKRARFGFILGICYFIAMVFFAVLSN